MDESIKKHDATLIRIINVKRSIGLPFFFVFFYYFVNSLPRKIITHREREKFPTGGIPITNSSRRERGRRQLRQLIKQQFDSLMFSFSRTTRDEFDD